MFPEKTSIFNIEWPKDIALPVLPHNIAYIAVK